MFSDGPGQKVLKTISEHGGSMPRVKLQAKHGDIVKRVLSHMKKTGLVESSQNGLEWSLTRKGRSLVGPEHSPTDPSSFCEACECTPCDCGWGN
jgi:predicted methyltransferase